jgi:hypothetical protein
LTGKRIAIFVSAMIAGTGILRAQTYGNFGVGAAYGAVNPVENRFRLENFQLRDASVWLEYRADESVVLRATLGSMKVDGHNAGETAPVGASANVVLPDLRDKIEYATVSAGYQFRESGFSSGLFGGVGGYRIRPETAAADYAPYQDSRETVWGFHFGAEAEVPLWRPVSFVARLTYHLPQTHPKRFLLSAVGGLAVHF